MADNVGRVASGERRLRLGLLFFILQLLEGLLLHNGFALRDLK